MSADLEAQDAKAREHSLDPRRCILLQAPAGSGKTAVLTQRFLTLLPTVSDPGEILAITFTLKAAAEMRARVMRALRGQIADDDPCAVPLRALAARALAHAGKRGWPLRDDPGSLRIQTIDAFNYSLASQLPLAARAGGVLEVADPATLFYQRAARSALMAAESAPDLQAATGVLFERLDNHWYRLEGLLLQMLAERGHWLRFVLDRPPEDLCRHVAASLAAVIATQLGGLRERMGELLLRQAQALPGIAMLGAEAEHLPAWKELARLTQTGQGKWRTLLSARHLGDAFASAEARQLLGDLVRALRHLPDLETRLRDAKRLPAGLERADGELLSALSQLLARAAAHLQAEFAAAGRIDYTYLAGAAAHALSEAGQPTDLALRAGLSLRHILVDEFQDTSLAQFDLLRSLTAAWEPSDGRTLFVVGDPMQSIYRFRDAEVGLFVRARAHGIGQVALEPLTLTRNFRSVPALVGWFNSTFARVFPPSEDLRTGAVAYSASVAARGGERDPAEAVRLALFADHAGEAAAIAARIGELRRQDRQGSFAILVAVHAHAAPILAALESHAIASMGVDLVPLAERQIVRDLVQLMRALADLADRTAWLAVLRAPWCGLKLATLSLFSDSDPAPTVWEALHDATRLARCEGAERQRLERVRAVLGEALTCAGSQGVADLLERTFLALGGMDAFTQDELEDAQALFAALARRALSGEWQGPEDFGALLKQLFSAPRATGDNPVEIMTIHRAKGLQFDHVFVPALDRATRGGERALLEWVDLPRADGGSDLLMAPLPADEQDSDKELVRLIESFAHARDRHERARLLYVAATRAARTLHLSGAPEINQDGSLRLKPRALLGCLLPALEEQFERPGPAAPPAATPAPEALLRRLRAGWQLPVLPQAPVIARLPLARAAAALEFSWVGETQRHIGTIVHAALARAAESGALVVPERALLLELLRLEAVPEGERAAAVEVIASALERTFADPRGRWILAAHQDAANELPLSGLARGQLRSIKIDRTFIDADGVRWVIDYKTSRHEGADTQAFLANELERYREQLLGYVALAGALGPEPVRAALYFPLLAAFRELPGAPEPLALERPGEGEAAPP